MKNRTYDPVFISEIRNMEGNEFQNFCARLFFKSYKDFQELKLNTSDHGNDGYRHASGIFFAMYAPAKFVKSRAEKKIIDDARTLIESGEIYPIKKWIFVSNVPLPDSLHRLLQVLRNDYPNIEFESQSVNYLMDLLDKLSPEDIDYVFGKQMPRFTLEWFEKLDIGDQLHVFRNYLNDISQRTVGLKKKYLNSHFDECLLFFEALDQKTTWKWTTDNIQDIDPRFIFRNLETVNNTDDALQHLLLHFWNPSLIVNIWAFIENHYSEQGSLCSFDYATVTVLNELQFTYTIQTERKRDIDRIKFEVKGESEFKNSANTEVW